MLRNSPAGAKTPRGPLCSKVTALKCELENLGWVSNRALNKGMEFQRGKIAKLTGHFLHTNPYLSDEAANVGQNPSGCQVDLPVGRFDEFLIQGQVLSSTFTSNAQLIQVAVKEEHKLTTLSWQQKAFQLKDTVERKKKPPEIHPPCCPW